MILSDHDNRDDDSDGEWRRRAAETVRGSDKSHLQFSRKGGYTSVALISCRGEPRNETSFIPGRIIIS